MDRQMQCGLRGFYERRADRLREGLLTEEDIVEQCRKRRAIRATESRLDALDDDLGEEQEDDEAEPTAVGVLIIKDGNVLAGVRKSDFCPFTICGPGGHIEVGETPEEAAVRETQEEFGVTPTELVPIGMQTEQEERFGRNMLYLCTEYDGQISTDNVEIVAPHWLDYSEAVEAAKNGNEALFLPFARSLIVLDKELEKISEELANADGGPGSGNWGHAGRQGKRGGSAAGGGVQNRTVTANGEFSSWSKRRAKAAKPHVISDMSEFKDTPDGVVVVVKGGPYAGKWVKTGKKFYEQKTGKEKDEVSFTYAVNDPISVKFPDSSNPNYLVTDKNQRSMELRKAKAPRYEEKADVDALLRDESGRVWQSLSSKTKQDLYEFTDAEFVRDNAFLRGTSSVPASKSTKMACKRITEAIEKSELPDIWLQRGISKDDADRLFKLPTGTVDDLLSKGNAAATSLFSQCSGRDEGFMSCGSTDNSGLPKPVIMHIFCPKGTKGIYAEPYSAFGAGKKDKWDGKSKQNVFSGEFETTLQRGTNLQARRAWIDGNKNLHIECEVTGQEYDPIS